MEDNKKYDELKCILEDIKKAVSLYNDLNSEDKLSLTKQKEDVSNIFVCLHDDNEVGLFKRKSLIGAKYDSYTGSLRFSDDFLLYSGVNSHYNGVKISFVDSILRDRFKKRGLIKLYNYNYAYAYSVNCNIQEEMSFDDMRLMMYKEGLIEPYEIGKATNEEMLEVLKYAYNYYGLDKKVKKLTK